MQFAHHTVHWCEVPSSGALRIFAGLRSHHHRLILEQFCPQKRSPASFSSYSPVLPKPGNHWFAFSGFLDGILQCVVFCDLTFHHLQCLMVHPCLQSAVLHSFHCWIAFSAKDTPHYLWDMSDTQESTQSWGPPGPHPGGDVKARHCMIVTKASPPRGLEVGLRLSEAGSFLLWASVAVGDEQRKNARAWRSCPCPWSSPQLFGMKVCLLLLNLSFCMVWG